MPIAAATFPTLIPVQQDFPRTAALDPALNLEKSWCFHILPGQRIAIAVGSRGISRLAEVVAATVARIKSLGATPYLVPAMGSHGGATAEGQLEVLAGLGITPQSMGVPILADMAAPQIAQTADGLPVHLAASVLSADGILLINRIKPHTDFRGPIESGLLKMIAVGLGKQNGAAAFHIAAARRSFEEILESFARAKLSAAKFLGGIGLIENQHHDLAQLHCVPADQLFNQEPALLRQAAALMPSLPLDTIDLLIIDYIGKNFTGSGMDPNVVNRSAYDGWNPALTNTGGTRRPHIHRILVRDLHPETHGNAIGLGLADFCTTRVVTGIDRVSTYMNTLTSLAVLAAKIPLHFDTDRETIATALEVLALPDPTQARVVRINNTLALDQLLISPACLPQLQGKPHVRAIGPASPMAFDQQGNLPAFGVHA